MTTIARLYKDAELDIAGEINERLPKICDFTKINIQSVSNGKGTPYIKINDVTKINPPRSWTILRLDPFGEFVDSNGYDVFGNSSLAQNAIDLINNTPNGYTICIATFDEPLTNSINLRNLLSTFGFNILNYNWVYRCAWLGVFQKGANSILSEKYIDSGIVNDEILIPKVVNFPMDGTTKSIQGIDCIHDNCNLTNNGIYVEEGTTNLIGDHSINLMSANGWNFANHTNSGYSIKDPLGNNSILWNVDGGFIFLDVNTSLINVNNNYTFSIYIYANKDFTFKYRWVNVYKTMLIKANTWTRLINTQTYVSGTTFNNRFLIGYRTDIDSSDITPDNFQVAYSMAQLEEKPYATSYTSGTRPNSNNGVQIPTSYFQFPFSVTMEVIPDIKDGSNSVYGSEPQKMYIAGLWKPKSGGYYGEIHQKMRSEIINGLEKGFRYTIVFRASGYDIYMNNTKIVNNNSYYSGVFDLTNIPMFTVGCRGYEPNYGYANALYRNIAFYNRELTQDDVNKLCNSKFSMSKYGGINGLELIEENNLLLTPIDFSLYWLQNIHVSTTFGQSDPLGKHNAILIHPNSTTDNYFHYRVALSNVGQYTVSCWLKASKSCTIKITCGDYTSGGFSTDVNLTTEWKKIIFTGTVTGINSNSLMFNVGGWNTWSDNSFDIYLAYPRVIEGNITKMQLNQNELHVNELVEGSDL